MRHWCKFLEYLPPLLVALPELLASKLLSGVVLLTRSTLVFFAVLAQLFGNSELATSRCCHSIILRGIPPRNLQKWQAYLSGHTVPKHSGKGKDRFQRGQPTCACKSCVAKTIWFSIGGSCALNTSTGSVRPVRHLQVAGLGDEPPRSKHKLPSAITFVQDHVTSYQTVMSLKIDMNSRVGK